MFPVEPKDRKFGLSRLMQQSVLVHYTLWKGNIYIYFMWILVGLFYANLQASLIIKSVLFQFNTFQQNLWEKNRETGRHAARGPQSRGIISLIELCKRKPHTRMIPQLSPEDFVKQLWTRLLHTASWCWCYLDRWINCRVSLKLYINQVLRFP